MEEIKPEKQKGHARILTPFDVMPSTSLTPGEKIQNEYKSSLSHIKDLWDVSQKSVDILADCCDQLSDIKNKKDSLVIYKGKVDDDIRLIKITLSKLKNESSDFKKQISVIEKEALNKEKKRKNLKNKINSLLSQVVSTQIKRDKLLRKHSKKILSISESDNE